MITKKFSINKSRLNELWDYVNKAFVLWEKIDPWCDLCESWKIQIKKDFGYSTSICECSQQADMINMIVNNLKVSWVDKSIVLKYNLAGYVGGQYSEADTINLLSMWKWIYLYGDVWTGKTYTALIMLYIASVDWYTVTYANVPKLLDKLRPSTDTTLDSYMEDLCTVDFLVLDDIWQEKVSPWVLERLYIIINERYLHDKMTIFTSNCTIEALALRLSHKAIVSRIRGNSTPVYFIGNDKR